MSLSEILDKNYPSDHPGDNSLSVGSMDAGQFQRQFTRVTSPGMDADRAPATTEQLCALEIELRARRHRSLQIRREYERTVQDEQTLASRIQDDLEFRGALECLEITAMMCDMLPIELRDIIYRDLCVEDQPIPVGPYYHFRPYSEYRSPDGLASALSGGRHQIDHTERPDPAILVPDSHIFNYKYVGLTVAAELQAVYFANNTFSICDIEDGIAKFFRGAKFVEAAETIGILNMPEEHMRMAVRAFKLVRSLQIRLKLERYQRALDAQDLPGPVGVRERYAEERNFLRRCNNALSTLQSLPLEGQPLQLEFIIMTDLESETEGVEDPERCFINILQTYRNTFYALKYDRANTTITVVHHDEGVSPFPRTLSALWNLTREQWEHEKALNHGNPSWTPDFYLAPAGLDASERYGGFLASEQAALLRDRWGIENVFRDKEPKWPIVEGKYWPVGNGPPGWL